MFIFTGPSLGHAQNEQSANDHDGCDVFHRCLPFLDDHAESRFSFPWYKRKRTAKAATCWCNFLAHGESGLPIGASSADITRLLKAWSSGDQAALATLAERVYPELRRLARRYLKHERHANTLQATALVHEVDLPLSDVTRV